VFFKNKSIETKPRHRGFYAVLGGTYGGEFFIYIKESHEGYVFLSLPDKHIRVVPKDAYIRGVNYKLLDFISQLPKKIYDTVEIEYKKLNNLNAICTTKTNHKSDKRSTCNP
jgi:hypothetical protein